LTKKLETGRSSTNGNQAILKEKLQLGLREENHNHAPLQQNVGIGPNPPQPGSHSPQTYSRYYEDQSEHPLPLIIPKALHNDQELPNSYEPIEYRCFRAIPIYNYARCAGKDVHAINIPFQYIDTYFYNHDQPESHNSRQQYAEGDAKLPKRMDPGENHSAEDNQAVRKLLRKGRYDELNQPSKRYHSFRASAPPSQFSPTKAHKMDEYPKHSRKLSSNNQETLQDLKPGNKNKLLRGGGEDPDGVKFSSRTRDNPQSFQLGTIPLFNWQSKSAKIRSVNGETPSNINEAKVDKSSSHDHALRDPNKTHPRKSHEDYDSRSWATATSYHSVTLSSVGGDLPSLHTSPGKKSKNNLNSRVPSSPLSGTGHASGEFSTSLGSRPDHSDARQLHQRAQQEPRPESHNNSHQVQSKINKKEMDSASARFVTLDERPFKHSLTRTKETPIVPDKPLDGFSSSRLLTDSARILYNNDTSFIRGEIFNSPSKDPQHYSQYVRKQYLVNSIPPHEAKSTKYRNKAMKGSLSEKYRNGRENKMRSSACHRRREEHDGTHLANYSMMDAAKYYRDDWMSADHGIQTNTDIRNFESPQSEASFQVPNTIGYYQNHQRREESAWKSTENQDKGNNSQCDTTHLTPASEADSSELSHIDASTSMLWHVRIYHLHKLIVVSSYENVSCTIATFSFLWSKPPRIPNYEAPK
jgi:hypothetical protein